MRASEMRKWAFRTRQYFVQRVGIHHTESVLVRDACALDVLPMCVSCLCMVSRMIVMLLHVPDHVCDQGHGEPTLLIDDDNLVIISPEDGYVSDTDPVKDEHVKEEIHVMLVSDEKQEEEKEVSEETPQMAPRIMIRGSPPPSVSARRGGTGPISSRRPPVASSSPSASGERERDVPRKKKRVSSHGRERERERTRDGKPVSHKRKERSVEGDDQGGSRHAWWMTCLCWNQSRVCMSCLFRCFPCVLFSDANGNIINTVRSARPRARPSSRKTESRDSSPVTTPRHARDDNKQEPVDEDQQEPDGTMVNLDAAPQDPSTLLCFCHRAFVDGELMVGCDACGDWFHALCLNITKLDVKKVSQHVHSCSMHDM